MHANYTCPNCNAIKEASFSIKDGPPEEVFCDSCGQVMQRNWETSIHIPEDFSDDLTTTISQRMAHGNMPTGRRKIAF